MIDCHCHLTDISGFPGHDFWPVTRSCQIKKIYANTVGPEQWHRQAHWAGDYPEIVPFYGLHPWHLRAESVERDLDELAFFLSQPRTCCGEIGLDRLAKSDYGLQQDVFHRQLELAVATRSFVAIHCVKAWGKLLEILGPYQGKLAFMVHSFQGSREVMERLVALGGMISFSDRLMAGANHKALEVVKATPIDRLLLETDFPFHKSGGGDSGHSYCQVLTRLYSYVAQLRGLAIDELTDHVQRNGSLHTH